MNAYSYSEIRMNSLTSQNRRNSSQNEYHSQGCVKVLAIAGQNERNTSHYQRNMNQYESNTKLESKSVSNAYIVMDNVPFHHAELVSNLFASTSHQLVFLPPYSPFLNPIENFFNQLKHYVKKFQPKNYEELFNGVELASRVRASSS